jgi:hypothetical protein
MRRYIRFVVALPPNLMHFVADLFAVGPRHRVSSKRTVMNSQFSGRHADRNASTLLTTIEAAAMFGSQPTVSRLIQKRIDPEMNTVTNIEFVTSGWLTERPLLVHLNQSSASRPRAQP